MRERGSALLTAVVVVMVLLLVSGILFSFVKNQFGLETGEEKALKAYYLAEAGASYGIAYGISNASNSPLFENGDPVEDNHPLSIPAPLRHPFGSDYKGYFKVTQLYVSRCYKDTGNNKEVYYITVACDGYYPEYDDPNHILRSIKKEYVFSKDIPPPPPPGSP